MLITFMKNNHKYWQIKDKILKLLTYTHYN